MRIGLRGGRLYIRVWTLGGVDGQSDRGRGGQGVSQEAITFYSNFNPQYYHHGQFERSV